MKVGERILIILKEKKLTQKALSEYVGIKQSTISDWKGKGSSPSSEYIHKISEFLNVSPTYILTGKDNENSFTNEEKILLEKYNLLSEKNKGKVENFIDERIKEQQEQQGKVTKEA